MLKLLVVSMLFTSAFCSTVTREKDLVPGVLHRILTDWTGLLETWSQELPVLRDAMKKLDDGTVNDDLCANIADEQR